MGRARADPQIARLIAAGDETVRHMLASHTDHIETIEEVRTALADLGLVARWSDRPHEFRVSEGSELVVIVGGDGTLLGASHGIGPNVPLLGVNSSPDYSVGFFCGAKKGYVREALVAALDGNLRSSELARMRVELNGQPLHNRILNEALFCHVSPAATSRYILRVLGADNRIITEEEHRSSGVWVGPAAGRQARSGAPEERRSASLLATFNTLSASPIVPSGESWGSSGSSARANASP
jgi:NAD+ kinase